MCRAENVPEEIIHKSFLEAWNSIVRNKGKMEKRWARIEKEGTELERLRVRQMRELIKQGPLNIIIPELVRNVLECILVKGKGEFEVRFLDGTEFVIKY